MTDYKETQAIFILASMRRTETKKRSKELERLRPYLTSPPIESENMKKEFRLYTTKHGHFYLYPVHVYH